MRQVITSAFVTLDGIMQAPGGPHEDETGGFKFGGWVAPYGDAAFGHAIEKLFAAPFDLLLGRKTYDIFAAFWPYAENGADASIAKPFNAATKYVATRSDMPLAWGPSVRLKDAATDVAALKRQDGPALLTQGSSDLIQTLLAHDLIDDLHIFTFPIVLGRGKKLFGDRAQPRAFDAIDSQTSSTGVTISSYRRAGAVRTGDFTSERPPSPAELARREKFAREG